MTRQITVEATGTREELPELAAVEVRASGEAESAAGAHANARDVASAVRTSLLDAGFSDEDVRTVERSVEETSGPFEDDPDAPYRGVERLVVDCTVDTAEEAVVRATDAGGTVPEVRFDLPESLRRRLEEEALEAAMGRARARAERLAGAEGLSVRGVLEVDDADGGGGLSGLVDEAIGNWPENDFSPNPVTVSETVTVTYELGE